MSEEADHSSPWGRMEREVQPGQPMMSGALPDPDDISPPTSDHHNPSVTTAFSGDSNINVQSGGASGFAPELASKKQRKMKQESSLEELLKHSIDNSRGINTELPDSRSSSFIIDQNLEGHPTKSSLEELSRHVNIVPQFESRLSFLKDANIPLPESKSSSISQDESEEGIEQLGGESISSSSAILANASIPLTGSNVEPGSLALPVSKPAFLQRPLPLPPPLPGLPLGGEDFRIKGYDYTAIIAGTRRVFHHIKRGHMHAVSRQYGRNIMYVDSYESRSEINTILNPDDRLPLEEIRRFPKDLKQRLIVIEDLSTGTIHRLGELFGLTPEFFEEHLINSGYQGAKYNDPPSNTWKTSGMKKSYASIKWYRPVIRLNAVPYSNRDLEDLLDPSIAQVEYESARSKHLQTYKAETNIFRPEWPLWTNPKTTAYEPRVCGWEERASVWCDTIPETGCRVGMALLPSESETC
jgi:hypothetical protein